MPCIIHSRYQDNSFYISLYLISEIPANLFCVFFSWASEGNHQSGKIAPLEQRRQWAADSSLESQQETFTSIIGPNKKLAPATINTCARDL